MVLVAPQFLVGERQEVPDGSHPQADVFGHKAVPAADADEYPVADGLKAVLGLLADPVVGVGAQFVQAANDAE
jgi:hypothetical protein